MPQPKLGRQAGTGPAGHTFSRMQRVFLAIIVSGVLLIAVSTALFVLLNGSASTVSLNTAARGPTERPAPPRGTGDRLIPADRPTR